MPKFAAYLLFVFVAIPVSGLFGIVHDQISFTVSPEYFTRFKFIQFQLLDPSVPERLRVAAVGFLASWWMGVPLGLLSAAPAFVYRRPEQMRRALLWSLPLIVGFTLSFALGGLSYGFMQTQSIEIAQYTGWYIPREVQDLRNYLCVGYMHNAAYMGGALAIPLAWIFHFAYWHRTRRSV